MTIDAIQPVRHGTKVGAMRSQAIYGRSILLDIAHRLFRRRKRIRHQVLSDYDQGEWAQQMAARNWERVATLDEYVDKAWIRQDLTCLVDGRLWRMPARDYYRLRRFRLVSVLKKYAGDTDELIELGSGTGTNLFALYLEGAWRCLKGLELSDMGRAVAREVAARFGIADSLAFEPIDLLEASSDGFKRLQGKIAFTYYCLEQLPSDTERVLRNLHRAGAARLIHIEPSFELLKPHSLRDMASISYVWRQDYQRTLIKAARKLESEGLIRIVAVDRLHFSPTWRNPPTLLVWEPA